MRAEQALLVRYWAGARAAAGITEEYVMVPGNATVADVVEAVETLHPPLGPVLEVASLLLDGRTARRDEPVAAAETIEVLPPFAGG